MNLDEKTHSLGKERSTLFKQNNYIPTFLG